MLLGGALVLALIFGPQIWVRSALRRHAAPRPDLPGTGAELARHLIEREGLRGVTVERTTAMGDHYDGRSKTIRLSPDHYDGRSVAAAAVAAHEFGHALQDAEAWGPYKARQAMVKTAYAFQIFGQGAILMGGAGAFAVSPKLALLGLGVAIIAAIAGALAHLVTLRVEIDASFTRALPILNQEGYLRPDDAEAARAVLRAAAGSYVAAALASLLRFGRGPMRA
ncbi:MAG: zinc metallopeptidase [Pseudomonadota bacterium]